MPEETPRVEQHVSTDTYSYKGWLNSDSFLKRVFAVLGYAMVGQLILSAGFVLFAIIMMLMLGEMFS